METCPYCKNEIDSLISICPHCQKSLKPDYPSMSPKWFLGIWIFFLALVAVLLISMFGR
jgi:predicted amidophosphoribosyltransferase